MTEKLFADMMNLKNHVQPFPILDYKILFSNEARIFENNEIYKKQHDSKAKMSQINISKFFNNTFIGSFRFF